MKFDLSNFFEDDVHACVKITMFAEHNAKHGDWGCVLYFYLYTCRCRW